MKTGDAQTTLKSALVYPLLLCCQIGMANAAEPAIDASVPIQDCDRLAGNRHHPGNAGPGVGFGNIKVDAALVACERAVRDHPDTHRFRYQLARTLQAAERYEDANTMFRKLAAGADPFAMRALAVHYRYGLGVDTDLQASADWVKQAALTGNGFGLADLGYYYQYGIGLQRNPALAFSYYLKAAEAGNPFALRKVGSAYSDGILTTADPPAAKGWLDKALATYRTLAAEDDAVGSRGLGLMYSAGQGVKKDDEIAFYWFKKAVDQGNLSSLHAIAWAYQTGTGTKKNSRKACDLYQQSAGHNHSGSQNNLARCFLNGDGRKQDFAKAKAFFERSAATGNRNALLSLADMYADGRGVQKDLARAAQLYLRSAESGYAPAMTSYGYALDHGLGVPKNPELACDWYEQGTKLKNAISTNNLGTCFEHGSGRPRDLREALRLYEKSAATGYGLALKNAGDLYFERGSALRDIGKAAEFYRKSAEAGHIGGMYDYGVLLDRGTGVQQDNVKACDWYEKAAGLGHAGAMNNAGFCYRAADGRKKDYKQAIAWFRKASAAGEGYGDFNLGLHHLHGWGVKRSDKKAARYLKSAVEAGIATANWDLALLYDQGRGVRRNRKQAANLIYQALQAGEKLSLLALIRAPHAWSKRFRRQFKRTLKKAGVFAGPVSARFDSTFDEVLWNKVFVPAPGTDGLLRQQIHWIPRKGTRKGMLVRLCHAAGSGPRPLMIMNHGLSDDSKDRVRMRPEPCGRIAEYFTQLGYVVAFPIRRGFGETGGKYREGATPYKCVKSHHYVTAGKNIAYDIKAAIDNLEALPSVRAGETIVFGHSGGGWGTLALAGRNADGIRGYVNFSGAHGSNRGHPNGLCGTKYVAAAARQFGKTARKPSLWIYVENDSIIGPKFARRLERSYAKAGGKVEFHMLPAWRKDGHDMYDDSAIGIWGPLVRDWLTKLPNSPQQ